MNEWEFRIGSRIVLVIAAFVTAFIAMAKRERNACLACWAVGLLWTATQVCPDRLFLGMGAAPP